MPRLYVIESHLHSFYYDLRGDRVTIGADPTCNLVLVHSTSVAGRHCEIQRSEGRYSLIPTDQSHAVFLKEARLNSRTDLHSGDLFRLGDAKIYFLRTEKDIGPFQKKAQGNTPIEVLLEVTKALNSVADQADLFELIMDHAIRLVGAERGFLLLFRDGHVESEVARNLYGEDFNSEDFTVSRNIVQQVRETGAPVLTTNAQDEFWQFQSVVDDHVLSLIAVPLKAGATVIGAIYLDSRAAYMAFTPDAVALLSAFADQAAVAIHRSRLEEERREMGRIQRELEIASRLQLQLLPKTAPEIPLLRVHGHMVPAREVGGDYYDFIASPIPGHYYVAIGDVSGKGVGAGLVMVMARSMLRPFITGYRSPKTILIETNRLIYQDLEPSMFMSMLLLHWDVKSNSLRWCGAGHERILIFRNRTGRVYDYMAGGVVLGAMADLSGHLSENTLDLEHDDTVLLYTDGATEARNESGQELGLDRLKVLFEAYGDLDPHELVDKMFAKLKHFVGKAEAHDDITFVALKRV